MAVRIHTAAVVGFRNTSHCFPWAGNRAHQYPLLISRLLHDSSLAHLQAMSNSRKRRGTWQREFYGGGTFSAVRIHTAVVVVVVSHIQRYVADSKTLLYTVANPAHGLLNREKRTNKKSLAAYPVWGTRLSMLDWVRVAGLSCTRGV